MICIPNRATLSLALKLPSYKLLNVLTTTKLHNSCSVEFLILIFDKYTNFGYLYEKP